MRMSVGVGDVDVFGAEAQADDAGGDAAEDGEAFEEGEEEGEALDWAFRGESGADEALVGEDLKALRHAGRKRAARLDFI